MKTNLKRFDRLKNLNFLVILILVISVFAMPVTADQEPNDSFAEAEEITEGTYEGTVNETDEYDYYKIELNPSTKITITFTSYAEDDDQELKFYNPSQEEIFYLQSKQEIESTDEYYLANETEVDYWYIRIDLFWSDGGAYSFTVDLESQNDAGSGNDISKSYGDAYEVDTGIEVNGFLGDLDENDMYKIELDPSSKVTVSFTSYAEDDDQELKFYNPNKEEIFYLQSKQETENTDEYYLASETEVDYWYVEVNLFWSDYGDYQFTVDVESQNDAGSGHDAAESYGDAYEVDTGIEVNGFLGDLDENDMYKIELEPSSIVTISFTSYAEDDDQELKFYNPNKEEIFYLQSKQETEKTHKYYLANETETDYWYVEVNLFWSDYGDYKFTASVDYQDDAGLGGDVASEYSEAYEIEKDTTYEGYLMDLDEQDTYKIHLTPNSIITINLTADFGDDQAILSFINPNKEEQFTIYSSGGSKGTESLNIGDEFETGYWFIMIEIFWGDGGSYSFETDVVTTGGPTPVVVSVSSVSDTSITISWTENTDPDFFRYEIYVSITDDELGYRFGFINDQSETTYTIISLDTETTYYITVRVINTVEQTADSNQLEITTEAGAQAPTPVVVSLESKTSTSIEISWTESPDDDFDSYEIYVSDLEGASGFWEDTVNDQSTTTYTITDLDPDTTYYVMIRVYNTASKYSDSNQLEVTTESAGEPPSSVTVTVEEETQDSIEISWTECEHSNFDRYEIYMSHNEGTRGNLIEAITSRSTTSHEITGLDSETTCCFTVKVVTEDGQSADSEQVTAETLEVEEEEEDTPGFTVMMLLISISIIAVYKYRKKKK